MEIQIIKQEKSALPRTELAAIVKFDKATPSRLQINEAVAKKVKVDPKHLIVRSIQNYFGRNEALFVAHVYDNEEAMNSIEYPKMIAKNNKKAEAKPEGEA